MSNLIRGRDAVRILIEEIGDVIGAPRLREFETKVRRRMRTDHPIGATSNDWISTIAQVIVDEDDSRANEGFMRGIRRIRKQAGGGRLLTKSN